jgi:hypothetical protein
MLSRKRKPRKNITKGWFPKEAPQPTEDIGPSSPPVQDVGSSSPPAQHVGSSSPPVQDVGSSSPLAQDVGPSPSTPPRPKKVVHKLTPRMKKGD